MPVRRIERSGAEEQVARVHQRRVERFNLLLIPSRARVALERHLPASEERAEPGEGREGRRGEDDEVGRQGRRRREGDRQRRCDQGRDRREVRQD